MSDPVADAIKDQTKAIREQTKAIIDIHHTIIRHPLFALPSQEPIQVPEKETEGDTNAT